MQKKMLIDASLKEETRLAIMQGQQLEAFETETQRQIKGNIYLARITRVEPSLQAAFIEYGGNRQGFLAFPEIHSNYFQIPIADRKETQPNTKTQSPPTTKPNQINNTNQLNDPPPNEKDNPFYHDVEPENITQKSTTTPLTETATSQINLPAHKKYKIQEVIKRGQVLLIQITKEERGNKGAAATTLLSLAGRYCVLMPNTNRSGGVSKKISHRNTRVKIRDIITELEIPENMSLIIRTAGAQHPKSDIERDYEYLTRLWDNIRALTLESKAPALIYEEGDLVHRALRDMVKKDMSAIYIEGHDAYQKAKKYMELLMPSQLKLLHEHKPPPPIFVQHGVEDILENIHASTVQLKSGGYIVINHTEALVAIDINSGKATSEHHIEDTALKTNLEATEEIARQIKLRDLAGLIVIDFIDMEELENIREVEKAMRNAMFTDRARLQVGRINPQFGLLEMSRQRLRADMAQQVEPCPHCGGTGQIATNEHIAQRAIRAALTKAHREKQEEKQNNKPYEATITLNWPVVLHILNHKKEELTQIEKNHNIRLLIQAGGTDNPDQPWTIEKTSEKTSENKKTQPTKQNYPRPTNEAVRMATAYSQMSPPDMEGEPSGRTARQRNRRQRQRPQQHPQQHPQQQRRKGQAQKQSQAQKQKQRQAKTQTQAQTQTQTQTQEQQKKDSAKKPLWKKLFGKNK